MYRSEGNLEEQAIWVVWNNWLKIKALTTNAIYNKWFEGWL